jgi:hypothetical protein
MPAGRFYLFVIVVALAVYFFGFWIVKWIKSTVDFVHRREGKWYKKYDEKLKKMEK